MTRVNTASTRLGTDAVAIGAGLGCRGLRARSRIDTAVFAGHQERRVAQAGATASPARASPEQVRVAAD